jgi:hypothetical protein
LKESVRIGALEFSATVNTESNVGFEVLNKILQKLGLEKIQEYPEPRYSLKAELKHLLEVRNAIAHGNDSAVVVKRDDLDKVIKLVEILMDLILEKIINGIETKAYLKLNLSLT